jgi:CRISPR/Cas system-associated exonuclease Cas4 (RecB family)
MAARLVAQGVAHEEAVARGRKAHVATRDRAANVGILAHDMMADYLSHNIIPAAPSPWDDTDEDETRRRARKAFEKFLAWFSTGEYEVVLVEAPFIDEKLGYGGTVDAVFRRKRDGKLILVDFKTGKVHDEVILQLGGYSMLMTHHGMTPDEGLVVHVPVDEDEPLRAIPVTRRQLEQGACAFGCFFMVHKARKNLSLNVSTRGVP